MKIYIEAIDDNGEVVFRSESYSVDAAVQALYRAERHKLPTIEAN